MKKNWLLMAGFIIVLMFILNSSFIVNDKSLFSIIVLPDTQHYSNDYPDIFLEQTKWIKEQKDELNIACVIHEGDIVHRNTEREWLNANRALSVLDDVVPYCLAAGNHDTGRDGFICYRRDCSLFNQYFGIERFGGKPWYGGHFGDGNENAFYLIDTPTIKLMVLCLEFAPRNEILELVNDAMVKYKDYKVILVTHCYTYMDNARVKAGDSQHPSLYECIGNDGEELWNKFVRKHENIFLVLSGHMLGGLGRLTSINDSGNKVHQILANYQMLENGGNGWLRIMTFYKNKISVETYSPRLNEYKKDSKNMFKIRY